MRYIAHVMCLYNIYTDTVPLVTATSSSCGAGLSAGQSPARSGFFGRASSRSTIAAGDAPAAVSGGTSGWSPVAGAKLRVLRGSIHWVGPLHRCRTHPVDSLDVRVLLCLCLLVHDMDQPWGAFDRSRRVLRGRDDLAGWISAVLPSVHSGWKSNE